MREFLSGSRILLLLIGSGFRHDRLCRKLCVVGRLQAIHRPLPGSSFPVGQNDRLQLGNTMTWHFPSYAAAYLVNALFAALFCYFAWRRRSIPGCEPPLHFLCWR